MKKLSFFGLFLALFVFTVTAFGQTTVWYYTGTVTSLTTQGGAPLPSGVSVGDTITGTFSYGLPSTTTTYPSLPAMQTTNYAFGSGFTYSVAIGSSTWSYGTSGTIAIENNQPNFNRDHISVTGTGTPTSFPGTYPGTPSFPSMNLIIADTSSSYDLVSGMSLPRSAGDINFGAATSSSGYVKYSTGPVTNWTINYSITDLSTTQSFASVVSAVPEPQTYALIAGLATLGIAVYWRRLRKVS